VQDHHHAEAPVIDDFMGDQGTGLPTIH
jgi:hypothetical protein